MPIYNRSPVNIPAFQLRRPAPRDAEALSHFAGRIFPLGGRPGADPAHIAAYIAGHLTPEHLRAGMADPAMTMFLAEIETEIVGYAALIRDSLHPQLSAQYTNELHKLYVDAAHHGRGVADALTAALLEQANAPVWLTVFSENPRAVRFYQRWGFQIAGRQEFLVGDDRQQDFLMVREKGTA